jgi:hypothetical protein
MHRRYKDRVRVLTVYIKEAHPTDEWRLDSNDDAQICYLQPQSTPGRIDIANDFVQRFEYDIPLLVDSIHNLANEAYAAWPERLYIIDEQRRIAYKGGMGPFDFHPEEVEAWLARQFPDVPPLDGPDAVQGAGR